MLQLSIRCLRRVKRGLEERGRTWYVGKIKTARNEKVKEIWQGAHRDDLACLATYIA